MAYEYVVRANLSHVEVAESDLLGQTMPGMSSVKSFTSWGQEPAVTREQATRDQNVTLPRTLPQKIAPRRRNVPEHHVTPLLKRSTAKELQVARTIVKKALADSARLNKARVAHPLRNNYGLKPGTVVGGGHGPGEQRIASIKQDVEVLPLLDITDEIAAAAALVAEADSVGGWKNVTKRAATASTGTYWMQGLDRKGTIDRPDLQRSSFLNQEVQAIFRNVLDYGAVGDGITDDTKAINRAMGTNSTRCGKGCNGSTTKNAIVYFPPGTYLVSSTIPLPFGTQVIGDANNRPTIVAAPSFVGLGVLSTDEYTGEEGKGIDGGDPQYYVNTANFYRQIRNIVIDIQKVTSGTLVTCLHYQVAQATSLQNVELRAAPGSSQIGLYAENGSGGGISDVTFTGGGIGLKGGEQQFTAQRLKFNGCTVGIQVIWDWGWVWKSITMNNVKTGFKLVGDGGVGNIGSVSIMDSSFTNVETVVIVNPITAITGKGSTGIALENIALSGVSVAVADTTGATLLAPSPVIDQWVVGPVYEGSTTARSFSMGGKVGNYRRHSTLLDPQGNYFERPKPQYEDQATSMFMHTKDLGCKGDGSTDDTLAFQAALYASLGKILFVDAGSYILTSTITIPPGAKIVGEAWSQLVASGSYFSDASNPKVLIKVGNAGDIGNVEMQDLLFTTRGATAGLIVIQWNIQAATQGSAGLWDCHVRIGGATGTKLTPAECPPITSGVNAGCSAASLMMHLTSSASGYFENMWLWVADHMIDDPDLVSTNNSMVQTSIYVARGFLIESTKPTCTASEHAVFYQYNFHSAANIFAGMVQTESPYFQPTPPPPSPFAAVVGLLPGDPDYTCAAGNELNGCDQSWSVVMTGSENIFVAGAGIYTWFSTYAQTCIDLQLCQKALMLLKDNLANVRFQNLVTIGAKYMAVMDGKGIPAIDNLNVDTHPSWSQVSILDVGSNGTTRFDEALWIDPAIWDMDEPKFTCSPPCNVKLPPWKGATSTVHYPLITVSQGTWTSTITQAPLTITEWVLEPVTITQDAGAVINNNNNNNNNNNKRDAGVEIWPVPATTPFWPAVLYRGDDGEISTTSATGTFPKPAATPLSGSWPKKAVRAVWGWPEYPTVDECDFLDFNCVPKPWFGDTVGDPGGDDFYNENAAELRTLCPEQKSTSSTPPKPTTTNISPTVAVPIPAPVYQTGDPRLNSKKCLKGEQTEGARMRNATSRFCDDIARMDLIAGFNFEKEYPFEYNSGVGYVAIAVSLRIKDKCKFNYSKSLCQRYLAVPTDSCDCNGVNGKQGGLVENNCYKWRVDPNRRFCGLNDKSVVCQG
ncbi:pectate lyase superfamily protein-domain-containing protein [Neurospora crassa]|nr:pectate lyase superfamily protein-domain-containing protein [Neurospora crassa]